MQSEFYFHFIKGQVTQQHPNSYFNSQAYAYNDIHLETDSLLLQCPIKIVQHSYVHQVNGLLSCHEKKCIILLYSMKTTHETIVFSM